jgi:hypothetical protein
MTGTVAEKARLVRAWIRAFAVMFTGPILLAAMSFAGAVEVAGAVRRRRRPAAWALAACIATAIYVRVVRPWHLRWGSTPADTDHPLPGDELLPDRGTDIVHAVTIEAPPESVWPWIAQIGQDRGGFYSYEWLENLAGCRMRNADRVHPEWQQREIGETVYLHPSNGLEVTVFEPGHALGLEGWGTVIVEPHGEDCSRLIVRSRIPSGAASAGYATLMEIPHFVMERKMLLEIRERAERQQRPERAPETTIEREAGAPATAAVGAP